MSLILLLASLSFIILLADESTSAKTPNKWGTYWAFYDALETINTVLVPKMKEYLDSESAQTGCAAKDVTVLRTYNASSDIKGTKKGTRLFSFYCKSTKSEAHVRVKIEKASDKADGELNVEITEVHKSLKELGFDNDRKKEFTKVVQKQRGKPLIEKMLANKRVREKLNEYRKDCPLYGTETFYDLQRKFENALDYFRFPISCKTDNQSQPTGKMYIEIVQDNTPAKFYDGEPNVCVVEKVVSNSKYLRFRERP